MNGYKKALLTFSKNKDTEAKVPVKGTYKNETTYMLWTIIANSNFTFID